MPSDGMLVLDVTDPYNPVEVARFFDNSPEFIESAPRQEIRPDVRH